MNGASFRMLLLLPSELLMSVFHTSGNSGNISGPPLLLHSSKDTTGIDYVLKSVDILQREKFPHL